MKVLKKGSSMMIGESKHKSRKFRTYNDISSDVDETDLIDDSLPKPFNEEKIYSNEESKENFSNESLFKSSII